VPQRARATTLAYHAGPRVAQRARASDALAARGCGAAAGSCRAGGAMAAAPPARGRARPRTGAAAVAAVFESYGRYWVEMLRLPGESARARSPRSGRSTASSTSTDGLGAGNGVILALPHLGGWEWAARRWPARATPFSPVSSDRASRAARVVRGTAQRHRIDVVRSARRVEHRVARAARQPIVCLLCDRDIEGDGVEVEFFGERTTLPGGPATLRCARVRRCWPARSTFAPAATTSAWCGRQSR
jgi:lauroyl/myristoyl acyltransferase